jgi:hypothetical protein
MDPIKLKLFIEALKKQDTKEASEILDTLAITTDIDRGYKKALTGILAAVENKEVNSLFIKMLSESLTKKSMEEQRQESRRVWREAFRPAAERGYEKAWYDILSIFLGKKKVGLEKHVEGKFS